MMLRLRTDAPEATTVALTSAAAAYPRFPGLGACDPTEAVGGSRSSEAVGGTEPFLCAGRLLTVPLCPRRSWK